MTFSIYYRPAKEIGTLYIWEDKIVNYLEAEAELEACHAYLNTGVNRVVVWLETVYA